jgi:hypothetical protein
MISALTRISRKMEHNRQSAGFWALVIAAFNVGYVWLLYRLPAARPVQFWFTIAVQCIVVLGPFWMLVHWFVKRKQKLSWQFWMWLFFVPWGFLWYVFEKYEPAVSDLDRFSGPA